MTHLNTAAYMEPLGLIEYTDQNSTDSVNMWMDCTIPSDNVLSNVQILPTSRYCKKKNINEFDRFCCIHCDATFATSSNCKSHERTHTGEKPYKCKVCGACFIQNSNLKAHMRVHSGEKPFKCTECYKRFSRSSHLKGHLKVHTGELPYSCSICFHKYSSITQLKKHSIKHAINGVHICHVCDVSFPREESLRIHVNIHSSSKPYFCDYCVATFRSRDDLSSHRKLHPALYFPYTCTKCDKGYKIKICFDKHLEMCQGNEMQENGTMSLHDLMNEDKVILSLNEDCMEFDFIQEEETLPICKLELFEEETVSQVFG